jgi:hypothetical protein
MRFDVYGRFQLELVRENRTWRAYRIGSGTRAPMTDIAFPDTLDQRDIAGYLDDMFHELDNGVGIREL